MGDQNRGKYVPSADQHEEMCKEITQLRAELAAAREERDEADRRAGAAERSQERDCEAARARDSWLRKAKAQWGVDNNVSFDVVWAEALAAKNELAALRQQAGESHKPVAAVSWKKDGSVGVMWNLHPGCAPLPDGTKLYLAPPAAAPAGWKLVPVEPCSEMRKAFTKAMEIWLEDEGDYYAPLRDAIAAAPETEK